MKVLAGIAVGLLLLIGVMGIRVWQFEPASVTLTPPLEGSDLDQDVLAERLSQAIQFPTISHMEGEQTDPKVWAAFHAFLEKSFPLTYSNLERENVSELSLLFRWKGSNPDLKPILLMSHQDVVPVDAATLDQWSYPPFSGTVAKGVIYGRGAVDIKSGGVGILEAVEYLLSQGHVPERDVYLAFGHDEEIGGEAGAMRIAEALKSRGLSFQWILDEGGSIVTDGIIPGVERPVALVGIAEKGYVSLRLTANAVGGHSSMPPKHTALGVIAQALVDLEQRPFPANMAYSKSLFEQIGPAMGGLEKWVFANMWLTEPLVERILSSANTTNASIRTTTAVTMAQGSSKDNILPTQASAVVNFRIMPGETPETVLEYVTQVIANPDITVTMLEGFGNEPSEVSLSDNDSFEWIKQAIYRVTQDDELIVAPYLVTAGTDAKHYTGLSDSIYRFAFNRFTPDTLQRMHGIDEQIKVSDYVDVVRFYRELLLGDSTERADREADSVADNRAE